MGDRVCGMKKATLDFLRHPLLITLMHLEYLEKLVAKDNTFLITDANVFSRNKRRFKGWNTVVIQAGEAHKNTANG